MAKGKKEASSSSSNSDTQVLTQKEFQNERVALIAKESPGCRVRLEVRLLLPEVEKNYREAFKKINKEVSVPGFRKGKAPEAVLRQHYDKYIEIEWRELIAKSGFGHALDLFQKTPFDAQKVSVEGVDKAKPHTEAEMVFSYEYRPTVPQIDPKALTVAQPTLPTVEEKDVQEIIEKMRAASAKRNEISDRAVEEGDIVTITIEREGAPEGQRGMDQEVEIKADSPAAWLVEKLRGLTLGAKLDVDSQLDANASEQQKKAFTSEKWHLTVKKIVVLDKPAVDEAWAKQVGASSVEDLHTKIREQLEANRQSEERAQLMRLVEDALLHHYPFDVPYSLVEEEKKRQLKGRLQKLRREARSKEEMATLETQLQEEAAVEALRLVRLFFVLQALIQQFSPQVSREEVAQRLSRFMHAAKQQAGQNPGITEEMYQRVMFELMADKAMHMLLDKVNVTK